MDFYFIKWDEVTFLNLYVNDNYKIFTPYVDHFKPLFKLFYLQELKLFENNFLLYQYVVIFFHTIVSYIIFKIARYLLKSDRYALLACLIFNFNPINQANLFFAFNITIILNVLFFLLALFFLIKALDTKKDIYFIPSYLFTLLQVYFYSNGLLLPLILIIYLFLFGEKKSKFILPYIAIFFFNLAVYWYMSKESKFENAGNVGLMEIYEILKYYFYMFSLNFVRTLFFKTSLPLFLILITVFSSSLYFLYKKQKDINIIKFPIFLLSFYFLSTFLISVGRFRFGIISAFTERYGYYYIIPLAIFFPYLISLFVKSFENSNKILHTLLTLYCICFLTFAFKDINFVKTQLGKINMGNYVALYNYIANDLDPNFHNFYDNINKEQVKSDYLKFIKTDIKNDKNYIYLKNLEMEMTKNH